MRFKGRLFSEVLDYGRGPDPRQAGLWRGRPGGGAIFSPSPSSSGGYVTIPL